MVLHFYSHGDATTLALSRRSKTLLKAAAPISVSIESIDCEICYNVEVSEQLSDEQVAKLEWLLKDPTLEGKFGTSTFLMAAPSDYCLEVGPRLNVCTPFSTNTLSICASVGLAVVTRVECSRRFCITLGGDADGFKRAIPSFLHDRMTECIFPKGIDSFKVNVSPDPWDVVDVMGRGSEALKECSDKLGLAFDAADIELYTKLFKDKMKRNPTTVECFDLSQSNSEHSRHWFFCGKQVIDGEEQPLSLMKMVKKTQVTPNNSVIAFHDNSSAIEGYEIPVLQPTKPDQSSEMSMSSQTRHICLTAETHNFPTGIAPFPGATTGTGGRIRDNTATGRGAHVIAGTAGYCVGNLNIPNSPQPWEEDFQYPPNMAKPLTIEVEASNGASDYGNKFGEPVITGYTRSFGMRLPSGERREWVKPIMFTAGLGSMDARHIKKLPAKKGYLIAKVGGPAYRIGMGGGSASSVDVQGESDRDDNLDFNAVQRGDAEMEQKMFRAIRACIEMGDANPICSIHDQGAGGNGNVLKEISEPAGALIKVRDFIIGDPTLSTMELWGAEYQENDAILIDASSRDLLQSICDRERVPIAFVGTVTGDGKVVLDEGAGEKQHPYDMSLEDVLSGLPPKAFISDRAQSLSSPLKLPADVTVSSALDRVFKLISVGSKRFLTNKVDRSVTGLIAQQQCVGPLHTPLANVAVVALSHLTNKGAATSIGEQPIKMLLDVSAGARMSVAEGLLNIVWAKLSGLNDVKCSGNWMWAAKLANEGAALHDACKAMCDIVIELGFALDGGKDSLSMAAVVPGESQPVKAPGELVMSMYAPCVDVNLSVTPDLEPVKGTVLLLIDPANGKCRTGGSALAQVYKQLGAECPDVDSPSILKKVFEVTQNLIGNKQILAGHDRSDGGLITTLIEMAISGNCGIDVKIPKSDSNPLEVLFAEELGIVIQISEDAVDDVVSQYNSTGALCTKIGIVSGSIGTDASVTVSVGSDVVLDRKVAELRDLWESTSFELEMLQCNEACVKSEKESMKSRKAPPFQYDFAIEPPSTSTKEQKVAIIREEGSNGDREMIAALHLAGFSVYEVTMQDLQTGTATLDQFRGIVFVGGFSFADTCGSAKGWAAGIIMNPTALKEFQKFKARSDTFSLGVCNGCQLMGLLGWVGESQNESIGQAKESDSLGHKSHAIFSHNESGRYESRFPAVNIQSSPAMMLNGMSGATLGIWVAHGEGNVKFLKDGQLEACLAANLAPIRYVDDDNNPTTQYPFNPNGSPEGIAALTSPDGRHLAMMPHPERCILPWQWPWMPTEWRKKALNQSPWMRMFHNAKEWCDSN